MSYLCVFCRIMRNPVLLSDSCLHLFLQSQLSVRNIEACAEGRKNYTVTEAIQRSGAQAQRFGSEETSQEERESDSEWLAFVTFILVMAVDLSL